MLITQSPSNLEPDIFKNSATKIVFRLQSQEDIRMVADAAGFVDMAEYEYLSNVLVRLQRRQAIVCTPDSEPFLITARDFDPPEPPLISRIDMQAAPETLEQQYEPDGKLREGEEKAAFLKSIEAFPFLPATDRRAMFGWDDKKYSRVVNSLLHKGVIESQTVAIGRGSPRVLYQRKGAVPSIRHQFIV